LKQEWDRFVVAASSDIIALEKGGKRRERELRQFRCARWLGWVGLGKAYIPDFRLVPRLIVTFNLGIASSSSQFERNVVLFSKLSVQHLLNSLS
jgi:hypothetical protein